MQVPQVSLKLDKFHQLLIEFPWDDLCLRFCHQLGPDLEYERKLVFSSSAAHLIAFNDDLGKAKKEAGDDKDECMY